MKFHRNKNKAGITLVFGLILAGVITILVVSMANTMKSKSGNMAHFNNMYHTHRMAESAMNKIVGELSINANAYINAAFETERVLEGERGTYESKVSTITFEGIQGFYLATKSRYDTGIKNNLGPGPDPYGTPLPITEENQMYCSRLHTYARISNISEYFAAVNGEAKIGYPIDARNGKIYAKKLTFQKFDELHPAIPDQKVRFKRAEYVDPVTRGGTNFGTDFTHFERTNYFSFEDPADPGVRTLYSLAGKQLLFPQITQRELDFFKQLAHVITPNTGHSKCNFDIDPNNLADEDPGSPGIGINEIYPPGYNNELPPVHDIYNGHTNDNADHVYYCTGTMVIQGRIHGQILFVAAENIIISSSICSADSCKTSYGEGIDPYYKPDFFPGAGYPSSSTAHQAILIAGGDVIIQNSLVAPNWAPSSPVDISTITIQAMIMAPNGSFFPQVYTNGIIQNNLSLDFMGSMILGNMNSSVQLSNVFRFRRMYSYMDSLLTNPPPNIPAIIDIYHSFEEIIDCDEPVMQQSPPSTPTPPPDPTPTPGG